ncbi:MAG: hypothetical protein KF754_00695 [Planctomycetes bacterium]|nr:hypothetical protein [Planctomycetota bacterium]
MNRVVMPEWARTGKHPDYPSTTHLLGFGSAPGKQAAETEAAQRLEEAIVAHALTLGGPVLQGTQFERLVTERGAWFGLAEFGESVNTDIAGNGFEVVALRALHKGELALRAQGMIEQAREDQKSAPDPQTGGDLKHRIETAARAFVLHARLLALGFLVDGRLERKALEGAEDAALAIWELPGIVKLEQTGGGQRVAMQGGVAQPLTMQARFRNVPMAGVPLVWSLPSGMRGVMDGEPQTDAQGRASCRLLQASPTGDEFGMLRCQVNLDQMTARRTGIGMPAWIWTLRLPCRRNTELVVMVDEIVDDKKEGFERYFLPGLREWARGRGLEIAIGKPSEREFDYRLKLEGSIAVSTWMRGEAPMARTSGKLALSDHGDGRVLFEWTPGLLREGKPGNSTQSQALTTLREAAADGLAEFCSRLIATIPAPGEEYGRGR